jgi:hypothetical protein
MKQPDKEQNSSTCQLGIEKTEIIVIKVWKWFLKSCRVRCDNSFECESNLCIDSQCVSGLYGINLNWLKNIFGNFQLKLSASYSVKYNIIKYSPKEVVVCSVRIFFPKSRYSSICPNLS